MPVLRCYVDDRTMAILERESQVRGRTVEELAEAAIESEAIASLPGGARGMHWPIALRDQPVLDDEAEAREPHSIEAWRPR